MVIQDRRVQGLMDELELPPDRANLFEIIDADGSGTLQLSELVAGQHVGRRNMQVFVPSKV